MDLYSEIRIEKYGIARIEAMTKVTKKRPYQLCTERLRLITESWLQTEGEPTILRLAKAFYHVVEHMTIFIREGELIVGNGASKEAGVEVDPFMGPFSVDEIKELADDGFVEVSEEDLYVIKELSEFWKTRNLQHKIALILKSKPQLVQFVKTGILLPPIADVERGIGGWAQSGISIGVNRWIGVVDYEMVLNKGLFSLIERAEDELRRLHLSRSFDTLEKVFYLQAVIIALRGVIKLAQRYSSLAREMARIENNFLRKKELERIAAVCEKVPGHPASSFYEAMQSFWFIFLVTQQSTASAGRFDQYMYPFLEKDLREKNTSLEEVLELLMHLRLKDMELISIPLRKVKRQQYAGFAKWHNFTIGGVTKDGKDATNELTFLLLEAAKRTRTPHHTITLRVHEQTPDSLLLKALEVVKTGIGMPAFVGDKAYIEWLLARGVPLKMARDFCLAGCIEPSIAGNSRQPKCTFFVPAKVLEVFLHNGTDPRTGEKLFSNDLLPQKFSTFEDFLQAFKSCLQHFLDLASQVINIDIACSAEFASPIDSALMTYGIESGKSLMNRRMLYENGGAISLCGMINVVDSLAAIKKLVFEERIISLEELVTALDKNWNGFEWLRRLCLEAPKYGNDEDYVDSLAKDMYSTFADLVENMFTVYGEKFIPAAISITSQWAAGEITGATPDGRLRGEVLADGGASAMRGMDRNGPTALLRSASKIDQVRYQSVLLNMKLHPSTMTTREDMSKLAALIRTYFSMGGKHIQFNVINKEILVEAQRRPQEFKDLVVRVAGFSAYFVELSKAVQDEIIARTEYSL